VEGGHRLRGEEGTKVKELKKWKKTTGRKGTPPQTPQPEAVSNRVTGWGDWNHRHKEERNTENPSTEKRGGKTIRPKTEWWQKIRDRQPGQHSKGYRDGQRRGQDTPQNVLRNNACEDLGGKQTTRQVGYESQKPETCTRGKSSLGEKRGLRTKKEEGGRCGLPAAGREKSCERTNGHKDQTQNKSEG